MSLCYACSQELPHDLWRFDIESARLFTDGREIKLSARQAAILGVLLKRLGKPVHRDTIIMLIWGDGDLESPNNSLSTEISKLRELVRWTRLYIETHGSFGYSATIKPYHPPKP